MTAKKRRASPRGRERVICTGCGQGTTFVRSTWKRKGHGKCSGCGRLIAYQDLNSEG